MKDIERKINKRETLTDGEIMEFFDLPAMYEIEHAAHGLKFDPEYDGELFMLLNDVADQYDYGGDICFWVIKEFFIERIGLEQWFVEDKSSSDNDDVNTIAANAIGYYYTDDMSYEEALSLFGLDYIAAASLEIVDDDYPSECKVWVRRHYYSGHFATGQHSNYMSDDDFDHIVFDNAHAARSAINDDLKSPYGDDTYVLNHGESSSPDYYIVALW